MKGEKLCEYRIKAGLGQWQVALKLFVPRKTVAAWESGDVEPDIATLESLSALYGVSVDALVAGDGLSAADEIKRAEERLDKAKRKAERANSTGLRLNILIFSFMFVMTLVLPRFFPDIIPAHFTGGVVDRYGSRFELYYYLIIYVLFFIGDVAAFFLMKKLTSRAEIWVVHGVFLACFGCFAVFTIVIIFTLYSDYIAWKVLAPLAVTAVSAILGVMSVAIYPEYFRGNDKFGIRTKLTAENSDARTKVDRFASAAGVAASSIAFVVAASVPYTVAYGLFALCAFAAYLPAAVAVAVFHAQTKKRINKSGE